MHDLRLVDTGQGPERHDELQHVCDLRLCYFISSIIFLMHISGTQARQDQTFTVYSPGQCPLYVP